METKTRRGLKRAGFLKLLPLGLAVFILAACGNYIHDTDEYVADTSAASNLSPISFEKASYLFEQLEAILDADGGYLWGMNLHGPMVFADAGSRYAIANMPDVEGEIFTRYGNLYIGRIPDDIRIGSWNLEFGGRFWSMVSWDWIMHNINEPEQLTGNILHKNFHTQQPYVFGGDRGWFSTDHMEELDARMSVRLEINALISALRAATEEERLKSALNALSIRAERHKNHPGFADGESDFEILEGTTVYTEVMLLFDNLEDRISYIERLLHEEPEVRMFGYHTGAFYALLLDEFDISWRIGLNWEADLAAILKDAMGFEVIPFDEINLERYNYSSIRLTEEAWMAETEILTQKAKEALYGPVLLLYAMGEFNDWEADVRVLHLGGLGFHNYSELDYGQDDVHMIENLGTVFYGDFIYFSYIGELEVTGGFLMLWHLMWRHSIPAYEIEVDGNVITGPNWVLTLNEGFGLREVGGGHFGIERQ